MNWRQDPPDQGQLQPRTRGSAARERDVVLEGLLRFWLLIGLCGAVVGLAAYAFSSLQTPVYSSSAQIELVAEPYAEVGLIWGGDQNRRAVTQSRVASGEVVRRLVAERLDTYPIVSVTLEPDTSILKFRAEASTPEVAQIHASEFVNVYLKYYTDREQTKFKKALDSIESQIKSVNGQLRDVTLDPQTRAELNNRLSKLREDQNRNSAALALNPKLGEEVSDAQLPTVPDAPQPLRTGALGVLFGLLLGIGAATLLVLRTPARPNFRKLSQFRSIPVVSAHVPPRIVPAAFRRALAEEVATDIDSATARGTGIGALFVSLTDTKPAKLVLDQAIEKLSKLRGPVVRVNVEAATNIEALCNQTEAQRKQNRTVAIVMPIEGMRSAAMLSTVSSSVFVVFPARKMTERVLERRLLQLQSNGFTIDGLIAV